MNNTYQDTADYEESSNVKVWAKTFKDNKPIHASNAKKSDGPFYCPETHEDLIVRKCVEKIDHFAYKSRLSPTANRESPLHFDCKTEICAALKLAFPEGNWEVERNLSADKEKGYKQVRPDISGRIKGIPVVIEIQASVLGIKRINERTEEYYKRKANIIWIVPLEEEIGDKLFRPRLFERYLHSMYYGRVYYWCKGSGTFVQPVHFGTAEKYIELANWFEEDGEERIEGDYYKTYKRLKKPLLGDKVDIKTFEIHKRQAFEVEANEQKNIPNSLIFKDKLKTWWTDKPTKYRQYSVRNEDGSVSLELKEEKE